MWEVYTESDGITAHQNAPIAYCPSKYYAETIRRDYTYDDEVKFDVGLRELPTARIIRNAPKKNLFLLILEEGEGEINNYLLFESEEAAEKKKPATMTNQLPFTNCFLLNMGLLSSALK